MKRKNLEKIKYGDRVLEALMASPMLYNSIVNSTSIDEKTLRQVVSQLHKHGYINKDNMGRWFVLKDESYED